MAIFAKEDVNTGRQLFLDLAKFVAIFGMILSHVILSGMENYKSLDAVTYFITLLLLGGVFAAPVFMFSMGVGMSYSKRTSAQYDVKRGVDLTIKAWVLNLIRFPLPAIILWYFTKDVEILEKMLPAIFSLDILQFAGLAFFVFALFKKLNISAKNILLISVVLAIIGSFFREFTTGNMILNVIVGHFMGVKGINHYMFCFPLFHWLIFVAAGYYFGGFLKRCCSKDKFFMIVLPISVVIFISYILYGFPKTFGLFADEDAYYHMHLLDMVFALASIFLMLSICHFVSKICSERVLNLIGSVSRNINEIYLQQWVIIGWFVFILGRSILHIKFTLPLICLLTVVILIVSEIGARLYKKFRMT